MDFLILVGAMFLMFVLGFLAVWGLACFKERNHDFTDQEKEVIKNGKQ